MDRDNVFNLSAYRQKKSSEESIARGRIPLHISHLDGKVKGSPHLKGKDQEEFGDRMQRIRTSLEKINQLMAELKQNHKIEDKKN